MTGFECDNCYYITQTEDDHIVTDDGRVLCVGCAKKDKMCTFLKDNTITLFEIANIALGYSEMRNQVSEEMDLSFEAISELRENLYKYMNEKE